MSIIYQYYLNFALHISSDLLQVKVYYNLETFLKSLCNTGIWLLLYDQAEAFIQARNNSCTQEGLHKICIMNYCDKSWIFSLKQIIKSFSENPGTRLHEDALRSEVLNMYWSTLAQ